MLDVGFSEILLTSAIALIVLGPERLPKVARQVGNWMGRARAMARQLSEQLEREVNAEELLKTQNKQPAAAESRSNGTALEPSYTPTIAPGAIAPDSAARAAAPEPPPPPEPTYGAPASATTPQAMHASDKQVVDSNTPHE
ncbi:MAG TPA: Sec-independent protein translocase protein TatB [Steroidobacteraceae bacterium]|nr:Sec-independent protein translocase protein TatB [Steroidobacteraceae bacterium]